MDDVILGVMALAAIEVLVFGMLAGRARATYAVPAPATTGHPVFERMNRIHQNSVEQLVVFLPLLLVFALTADQRLAVLLGITFLIARVVYAVGYARSPEQRAVGAAVTFLVQGTLALGTLVGVAYRLLAS